MPRVDVSVETAVSKSPRARQLEALFDVPYAPKSKVEWHGELNYDDEPWNVGLIVGPSGSGKTVISQHLFGEPKEMEWGGASVIDDFPTDISMPDITAACQAVGFNTIPAWLRPYDVLSNGEKFRVQLARHLLSNDETIVVDEFTSVVDRQVAKIGCHAVQKYVRKANRRFVGVSCHYDIIDWLQPDWVFEPATWNFQRRLRTSRPRIDCTIAAVPYSAWRLFAPYHYLTADLNKAARCFVLFVGDDPAAFAAILFRPTKDRTPVYGLSRLVTLPDWQGLGLAFVLTDKLASLYSGQRVFFHTYPAHPSLVRSFDRSPQWEMRKRPGVFSTVNHSGSIGAGGFGGRPNAVFRYRGPKAELAESLQVLGPVAGGTERRLGSRTLVRH